MLSFLISGVTINLRFIFLVLIMALINRIQELLKLIKPCPISNKDIAKIIKLGPKIKFSDRRNNSTMAIPKSAIAKLILTLIPRHEIILLLVRRCHENVNIVHWRTRP